MPELDEKNLKLISGIKTLYQKRDSILNNEYDVDNFFF